MVAELVEAHRVERSEKRKFKILHVTKILNFIFLTHYNKIGISWMKSIYVNERQESVLISTKIVKTAGRKQHLAATWRKTKSQ